MRACVCSDMSDRWPAVSAALSRNRGEAAAVPGAATPLPFAPAESTEALLGCSPGGAFDVGISGLDLV